MRSVNEFFGSPLALLPSHAYGLLENLKAYSAPRSASASDQRRYEVVAGAAFIPICGVLVHDKTWWSWDEMSYDEIANSIASAMVDPEVKGIILVINSPGGEVAGCFDLCDAIYQLRGTKPMIAVVDEAAFSAAYAIASSADMIILPRTGGVGSVGVITMHIDITKMLVDAGVKVTTIQFGDRKADGQPTTELSDEAREILQTEIDKLGEMFVSLVARNRGIKRSTVRATQAGCFTGDDAVAIGFADEVMPAAEAVVSFIQELQ